MQIALELRKAEVAERLGIHDLMDGREAEIALQLADAARFRIDQDGAIGFCFAHAFRFFI
ncbi:hypothetical protein IVB11_27575 [Bradyrhizobium sp. 177]|uniref:hypothetical protein n=1 Tax=Bradyrhizobium sp. 177 TaxID=2782647 RepID=UPI001FF76FA2|nr:hypothetical protein [Bradyrhizobium sp. 177]MCK1552700.1 hypothetical protein [Bradyrhizobium sp. 177]